MYAQSLIEVLPQQSTIEFTTEQYNRWNHFLDEYPDDTLYVIAPIDFSSISSHGYFTVTLPGGYEDVLFKMVYRAAFSNGDVVFSASLINQDTTEGSLKQGTFTFVQKENQIVGSIILDRHAYEIRNLKDGKYCLIVSELQDDDAGCGSDEEDEEYTPPPGPEPQEKSGCCIVDVLVFYDSLAAATGDIHGFIALEMERTRLALHNSNVSWCDLRLNLVGVHQYNVVEPSPFEPLNDLEEIRDSMQWLRDSLSADIVMFYTGRNYFASTDIAGIALGLIRGGASVDPVEDAYALVEATKVARNRFTFTHELGHLFQCRHEMRADTVGTFQYGHTFKDGPIRFGTIMYAARVKNLRLLAFSNPDLRFGNKPLGIADRADNARQLREQGCTVAENRQGIPRHTVYITGEQAPCPFASVELQAVLSGDVSGPFTFLWEAATSFPGVYFFSGNTPIVNISAGEQGSVVFVRLTVTSVDGYVAIEFFEIAATDGIHCTPWSIQRVDDIPAEHLSEIKVWPNPGRETLEVRLPAALSAHLIQLEVIDISGKVILTTWWKDVPEIAVDILRYSPGMYWLKITGVFGVRTIPFSKH
ncbi:MAG: zinc-dependent metalloprotease [Saprospiraceae bacterium]|nr:zinc-dependent metalloprotease [Saprospiraceae bacterium]